MADITFDVQFDYSTDNPFPANYPHPAVNSISTNDKDFAKNCGWLSCWGKELTGIDQTKQGGNAFEGEWLFTRKHVTIDAGGSAVQSITCNMDALNLGNSPIVASLVIDNSTRVTAIVLKKSLGVASPQDISVAVQSVTLPYPADFAWANHPQRPNAYSPVSKHAPHIARPMMTCVVKTSVDYVCHVVLVDQSGATQVVEHPQNIFAKGYSAFAPNANTAAANMLSEAVASGAVTFSKFILTAKIGKKYAKGGSKQQAMSQPADSTFNAQKALANFVKPDEIDELPVPPKGFTWYSNVRGVLFLEGNGQVLWPHEVFDLAQMYADLVAFQHSLQIEGVESKRTWFVEKIAVIEVEIERTRTLFKYMESVADGLVLNCKAFGDFK
jgi:hypothetical protein